ncbi:hypothetical protein NCCP1664_17740 [Zafaria cholistanensis]|uniref:Uncharacterized protein n=1 Tax=Zafaria cholistanensis TaxID=1682741 RepID=A0A5A7NTY9_9MICC|nr:hypothetical protein [Zafaria cholistanensis]GER23278.1 hypothetical protein NCCP1664_17740 [Zafaria cholistanensis]
MARQAQAAIIADNERRIEVMNLSSAAPEKGFGAHTLHTEAGPFLWTTLTGCWRCEQPMLLWDAMRSNPRQQYDSAPAVQVKSKVGITRYENHPEVHRLVDQWIRETGADIGKARIELRRSKTKGEKYSAFVCPSCEALAGQFFISCIYAEHWSLISAPLLRKADLPDPSPYLHPRKQPAHRPGPETQQTPQNPARGRPPGTSRVSDARWARQIREKLALDEQHPAEKTVPFPKQSAQSGLF